MKGYAVVLITVPRERADELVKLLVEERLCACVNLVREVKSLYWWKGKVEEDEESLLVGKTSLARVGDLVKRVKEVHPYTVPEIVALPIVAGNPDYLGWMDESLG